MRPEVHPDEHIDLRKLARLLAEGRFLPESESHLRLEHVRVYKLDPKPIFGRLLDPSIREIAVYSGKQPSPETAWTNWTVFMVDPDHVRHISDNRNLSAHVEVTATFVLERAYQVPRPGGFWSRLFPDHTQPNCLALACSTASKRGRRHQVHI